MVNIRNFNEDDVAFIFDNWAENPKWDGCKFDKDKIEILSLINEFNTKRFNNKYFEQFVIINCEEPVGMISLFEQSNLEVSVNVFIHKDFRRKGIATEAYKLIEKIAKDKGYNRLISNVSERNYASINLHLKLGFNHSILLNNYNENQIKFVKELL